MDLNLNNFQELQMLSSNELSKVTVVENKNTKE